MDTELLKTFLTVSRLKSFTLAAKELQLTQPALSKRIKRLEEIVGNHLFDRIGSQLKETEAGALLIEKTPLILANIDNAIQEIQDLSGQVAGKLHIGTSHYIGLHKLPSYLENYIKAYPKVDLDIDFIDSELAYERVVSGDLELALLTFPKDKDPRLQHQLIWQEQLHIVCHKDHFLAQVTNPLRDLGDYPCILPPAHTFPRLLFEHQLESLNIKLGKIKTANYLEVIAKLVACNMGWTLLPETLISAPLISLSHEASLSQREMGIIYRHNKTLSNSAQALVDLLHT